MGSIFAGRRLAGAGQLVLAVAGFILLMCWFVALILRSWRMIEGQPDPKMPPAWLWICGLLLFLLSWFWAWATTLAVMRAERRAESNVPPVL
ncbi:MAG TPA: hypothetical protein VHH88_04665 [Verrucomicrobiae bacterium]|nr:hypothetical protein [Verrucomicrobiae bacterium]